MKESLHTRFMRHYFNWFPAYRGTGARVTFIASDWHEIRIKIPLNWRTRNYVGTIFGGSMFGATDPMYMLMLLKILGKGYIVWDKAASIRYKKPAKTTLYGCFSLDNKEIQAIHEDLKTREKLDRVYTVDLVDHTGVVYASLEKTVYIAPKR